jgi:hypothetical protein
MSASHPLLKFKLARYPAAARLDAGPPRSYLSEQSRAGHWPAPEFARAAHVYR